MTNEPWTTEPNEPGPWEQLCDHTDIRRHLRGGVFTPGLPLAENINPHNLRCLAGMIETGEITFSELGEVGGLELVNAVHAVVDHMNIQ